MKFHPHCKCPSCGGDLFLKNGRYGQFYSCSNYSLKGVGHCAGKINQREVYRAEKEFEVRERITQERELEQVADRKRAASIIAGMRIPPEVLD